MVTKSEQSAPNETLCPTCGGIMLTDKAKADAKKRGNKRFLQAGKVGMSEMGKLGGNPKSGGYTGPPPKGH